ncbi:MAG: twin-arginine translocation signal domain-containing protein [Pirellulaceae bacterium]
MWHGSRRDFLQTAGAISGLALAASSSSARFPLSAHGQATSPGVEVVNPRLRAPLSFIIDDSTCLVNMGRFCMPQFATAWPDRAEYNKPWKTWPAEIPDAFVREFGEWCAEHGVRGKYSVVPYPACVGWLDRELPGWSRQELNASLQLVRELMVPHWDIHPEMITHTRVIDLHTGRPLPEISPATMENSYPQSPLSVDELAGYLAYALQILKNCDLPCEGVTTPGGFGGTVPTELSLAVQQAVRDVYGAPIPHYFKYVAEGDDSAMPRIEHVRDAAGDDPQLTISIYAGTGDWFGGWDGDEQPAPDKYCNREATAGRLIELIGRGEPAIMLCHWPGMYTQGTKAGFAAFQRVVLALEEHLSEKTLWMKPSEIARYWACRQLTQITSAGNQYLLQAPFACPRFTLRVPHTHPHPPVLATAGERISLQAVTAPHTLREGTWFRESATTSLICFDLPRGETRIQKEMTNDE